MKLGGMVDDAMAQQRPILHQAAHGIPLLVYSFLDRRPSPAGLRLAAGSGGAMVSLRSYGRGAVFGFIPVSYKCPILLAISGHAASDCSSCGWPALAAASPPPRTCRCRRPRPPIWSEPQSFRDAAGPDFDSADVTGKPSRVRSAAASHRRHRADAAADRAGRLRRQRHGAARRRCCCPTARASRSSRRR